MIHHDTFNRIIKSLMCILIFISPLQAGKIKTVSLAAGIRNLAEQSLSGSDRKKIRLAVLPFSSTNDTATAATPFGEYFSDQLITAFSKNKRCILYERGRMDALGKELALNLTGLIDEKAAKKIGEMAPIDFLMTGTYTQLKTSIEINARLIDVITGEIKSGFTGRVKLTSKLKALFPEETQDQESVQEKEQTAAADYAPEDCDALLKKARALTKGKKYDDLIALAKKHPLTSACGAINYQVIEYLIDNDFFDNSYKKWLIKQLSMASEPDRNRTTVGSVVRYFSADGNVDNNEWKSFTDMLRYSGKRNRAYFVRTLFRTDAFINNGSQWRSRMDAYICTIALPDQPVNSSGRAAAFSFLTPQSIDSRVSEHFHYWFEKHLDKLRGKDSEKLLKTLTKRYAPAYIINNDSTLFISALDEIITCLNNCPASEQNALAVHYLIAGFLDASSERFRDEWIPFFSRQLDRFMKACHKSITAQYVYIPENTIAYCTGYCLRYDIRVPGKIPTIEEVAEKMKDPGIRVRIDAAELLAQAGNRTLPVVPQLKRALERSVAEKGVRGNPNFQYGLIDALANSGTTDPDVHAVMISMFEQPKHTDVPKKTREALSGMGPVIIPSLKKAYPSENDEVKMHIIATLKTMKTRAKEAVPWLRKIRLQSPTALRDAIDDALEAIDR